MGPRAALCTGSGFTLALQWDRYSFDEALRSAGREASERTVENPFFCKGV